MWKTPSLLFVLVLGVGASSGENSSYLPTIQERWNASDLVCIGKAESPLRTGVTQFINGADRDQLSANVELERCFKGQAPISSEILVVGNYVAAAKKAESLIGFVYSGPPVGFVHQGRNLLFLRKGAAPDEFAVTVPIYQTAIPLAEVPPEYPSSTSPGFTKAVLIRELESAMLEAEDISRENINRGFGDPLCSDIEYINYLMDYLGTSDGIAELSRLSQTAPLAIQQDVAVKLLDYDPSKYEPSVISLLLDHSAPAWKRGNAALALGRNGTGAALDPLQRVVLEPAGKEQLKMLRNEAESSLASLRRRVESPDK
jgi:hypothetical protein